ncbi:hypothetical protein SteCoe_2735 [Stentor coeruleus]|uniref:Uncharacterized protein n=1 Tax=Stentor coeruleus TaxID=5963 RepID=A0A1R2CYN9_9CILI|nr:hypothetical protein SteCoe_2735 [Stentor coeruleus]
MSRPKTAVHVKRTKELDFIKKKKFVCPLDNPDLPIVSELEHRTGHCYCHHCICETHICPGPVFKLATSARPNYLSAYKIEYVKKPLISETPILPKEYKSFLKTSSKINQISTKQSDFKDQGLVKSESCKPKNFQSNLKFSGRTSYDRDFTDWGAESNLIRANPLPYRGYMLRPWNLESNYQQNYRAYPNSKSSFGITQTGFGAKSLVHPSDANFFETTTQRTFRKFQSPTASTTDLAKIRNGIDTMNVFNSKNHYSTSYSTDFVPKPIKNDLSRLR